jgi:hypothetical protein
VWKAPRMTGIDIDLDTHPGPQRRQIAVACVDAHPHRDTLHDLHPVTAGVLRRQKREFLGRGRADAFNGAPPLHIRIGIHRHRHRLPWADIRQFRFLGVRVDPDMIGRDEIEGGGRCREIFAKCNRRHICHNARERRPDDSVGKLTGSLVALSDGVDIPRILIDWAIRITVEVGGNRVELLRQRGELP